MSLFDRIIYAEQDPRFCEEHPILTAIAIIVPIMLTGFIEAL